MIKVFKDRDLGRQSTNAAEQKIKPIAHFISAEIAQVDKEKTAVVCLRDAARHKRLSKPTCTGEYRRALIPQRVDCFRLQDCTGNCSTGGRKVATDNYPSHLIPGE